MRIIFRHNSDSNMEMAIEKERVGTCRSVSRDEREEKRNRREVLKTKGFSPPNDRTDDNSIVFPGWDEARNTVTTKYSEIWSLEAILTVINSLFLYKTILLRDFRPLAAMAPLILSNFL